jgi:hypothetical protein
MPSPPAAVGRENCLLRMSRCALNLSGRAYQFFLHETHALARAAPTDIIRRDKRAVKRHEPGVCLCAIYLAPEPEERAIEHDDGE